MPESTCKHENSAPADVIEELPYYQGQEARHRCAVCAYNKGVEDGFKEGIQRGAHAVMILGKALASDDIEALSSAVAHVNFILNGGEEAG